MTYISKHDPRSVSQLLINHTEQIVQWAAEGMPYAEMGDRLGVRSQSIYRAVAKLRKDGVTVANPIAIRQSAREAVKYVHRLPSMPESESAKYAMFYALWLLGVTRSDSGRIGAGFSLELGDIYPLAQVCPVLGIPLVPSEYGVAPDAPRLWLRDRSFNAGYTPDNTVTLSRKASLIMGRYTWEELGKAAVYLKTNDLT